jgi:hypothetical protein
MQRGHRREELGVRRPAPPPLKKERRARVAPQLDGPAKLGLRRQQVCGGANLTPCRDDPFISDRAVREVENPVRIIERV